jgi:hypothetical protein
VLPNSPPKLGGVARSAGWFLATKSHDQAGKAETFRLWNHPGCAANEASRHFLNGAATPSNSGGELDNLMQQVGETERGLKARDYILGVTLYAKA